jgi:excisionase family DNA binding protein
LDGVVRGHDRTSPAADSRLLYSVEEAARLLGIGRTFMFHLVATGEVDSLKIGKRRKIPRHALDDYVARLIAEQNSEPSDDAPLPIRRNIN